MADPQPTWDLALEQVSRYDLQVQMLNDATRAACDRIYWYSVIDLDPRREAIEGFHVDENEYHLGLVTFDATRKPAFDLMKDLMSQRPVAVAPLTAATT